MIYLLDADHVSAIQRGSELSLPLIKRLRLLPPDDYGTTIVTYEEQCRGRLDRIHQAKNSEERLNAYQRLSENLRFFAGISVWEYTLAAETEFTNLSHLRLGTKDRLIAAIALANNATILTRNLRDFQKVPDLHVADWTLEPTLDV